jgi:hypothetical protein
MYKHTIELQLKFQLIPSQFVEVLLGAILRNYILSQYGYMSDKY